MGVYRVPPGDAIAAFSDAIRQRGLIPPNDLIADGRLHGCQIKEVHRSKRTSVPS